jgi:hypothetical protein
MSNGLSNLPYVKRERPSNGDRWYTHSWFVGLAILTALIVIGTLVLKMGAGESSSNNNQYEAVAQCEARVDNLLKSPATSEFDSTPTGSGAEWTVAGTVDSENSFGGTVRSEFQCTVTIGDGEATTTVDYLR